METGIEHYDELVKCGDDFEYMNFILNSALRSQSVTSSKDTKWNYDYLCTIAKSLGFKFGEHFTLLI